MIIKLIQRIDHDTNNLTHHNVQETYVQSVHTEEFPYQKDSALPCLLHTVICICKRADVDSFMHDCFTSLHARVRTLGVVA